MGGSLEPEHLWNAAVFATAGMLLFLGGVAVASRVVPRLVRRNESEEQDMGTAITLGAVVLGLAMIVASAFH